MEEVSGVVYKRYNENIGIYCIQFVCNTWDRHIAECCNLTLCNNVWLALMNLHDELKIGLTADD